MNPSFIGSGWAYPLRVDATGGIALSSRQHELEESMRLILGTARGERPMRPDFGCGIHDYIFAAVTYDSANRMADEVRSALARWEPRVTIVDVIVNIDEENPALLYIDVRYTPRDENDPRNLVFPFYSIPAEEG